MGEEAAVAQRTNSGDSTVLGRSDWVVRLPPLISLTFLNSCPSATSGRSRTAGLLANPRRPGLDCVLPTPEGASLTYASGRRRSSFQRSLRVALCAGLAPVEKLLSGSAAATELAVVLTEQAGLAHPTQSVVSPVRSAQVLRIRSSRACPSSSLDETLVPTVCSLLAARQYDRSGQGSS